MASVQRAFTLVRQVIRPLDKWEQSVENKRSDRIMLGSADLKYVMARVIKSNWFVASNPIRNCIP